MKKIILASVAVVAMSAPSFAADLAARPYTKAPAPMVSPATNWSGFYVGAMGGYGWSNSVSASVGGVNLGTANTDALKGGFGVMFDDLLAAGYTLLCLAALKAWID